MPTGSRGTVPDVPGTDDTMRALADELAVIGRRSGLDAIGVAPAEPFVRARQAIEERKAAGLHGGMAFTFKNPARSTDPSRAMPGARAIVVGARRYANVDATSTPTKNSGRVARYAWVDHYAPLRDGLRAVAKRLKASGYRAIVFADDNSLVDRESAFLAGLGWYGKNANLLLPGQGSWFVLGGVVTNAPLPAAEVPVADGCGRCHRCIDACPTGAIIAPGVVDARRCLAWVLQAPGIIPDEFRVAIGDRIYGCDDCQEVCPPNGTDHRSTPDAVARVDLVELLSLDDEELLARHGRWYLWQRDVNQIRRNALVALGNTASTDDEQAIGVLRRYLASPRPVLRAHAVWAARRLGRDDLLTGVDDGDTDVRTELEAASRP